MLAASCGLLCAADEPKISDAQRAKFWRAAKELAEWQARAVQARVMTEQAQQSVQRAREEMAQACGDTAVLAEDQAGEPVCKPKSEAKK
jgi:hypothetical protein